MSKEQIVADGKAALLAGQDSVINQVLSDVADKSAQEQKASDGTLTQGDLDAAIKAATDPLNAQIAQDATDLAAAHADSDSKLAALQTSLDDMTKKEQLEESAVADVKAKIDSVQASFDAIKALFNPPV